MDNFLTYSNLARGICANNLLDLQSIRGGNICVIGDNTQKYDLAGRKLSASEVICSYALERGAKHCTIIGRVQGFDLERRTKTIPGVDVLWGNIDTLTVKQAEDRYSCIVLLEGLERCKNIKQAVSNVTQMLRENGYLYVLTRTPDDVTAGPDGNFIWCEDTWRFSPGDVGGKIFCNFSVISESQFKVSQTGSMRWNFTRLVASGGGTASVADETLLYCCQGGGYIKPDQLQQQGFFQSFGLETIGARYETDKSSLVHNYLNKYEFFLNNWRDEKFNLLELGVYQGASERMWRDYFQNANIIGVDIDERCKAYASERLEIVIADLADERNLQDLKRFKPRLIIDDASHIWSHQIKALFVLFDCLPSGGIYIIEDMETSLNEDVFTQEYCDYPIDAYTVCERILRVAASKEKDKTDDLYAERVSSIGLTVEMGAVLKGACIFVKK